MLKISGAYHHDFNWWLAAWKLILQMQGDGGDLQWVKADPAEPAPNVKEATARC